ncbi:MAG: hypothetical protein HW409_117 [candidate division NC10 bacterium]|nr:hypothetical protein [candidate division NC10 bacterium]
MMNRLPQPFGAGRPRSVLPSERQELPPRAEAVVERCQGRLKLVRWCVLLAVLFGLVCRLSQYALGCWGLSIGKKPRHPGFSSWKSSSWPCSANRSMSSGSFRLWPDLQG